MFLNVSPTKVVFSKAYGVHVNNGVNSQISKTWLIDFPRIRFWRFTFPPYISKQHVISVIFFTTLCYPVFLVIVS